MKNKYIDQEDEFLIDEDKAKPTTKQDNELFNDNSYVVHDLLVVKRIELPKKGEDWEILQNKKSILRIKGIRFSKKERQFLRTANGFQFIMAAYKKGAKSISDFKREIKKCI